MQCVENLIHLKSEDFNFVFINTKSLIAETKKDLT